MPKPSELASQVTAATALLLLLLVDGCVATTHRVGGLDAWAVPPASRPDVYLRWGKSAHVRLGDSLMFLYPPGHDDVVQVTARAAARCSVSAPLLRLADGNSVFNLTAPGRAYFTSSAAGHCRKGQKLSVDVPTADGKLLPPSADDQAALKALAALPPAAAPVEALPTLSDNGDDSATGTLVAAGAGSVVAVAAAAALSLALFL
jgi:hypothetical protein